MLKYINLEKTVAQFNGAFLSLTASEDFSTIGDGPTREAILAWLAEGNEPEPADIIPTPIPQLLTNYQGKVTLDAFQLYEEVELYMQLETTPRAAKLAWATGAFERQGSLILSLANDFGITDEQLDVMFIYGSQVQ